MNRSIYWVMALAAGLVVANNYYNQPLLVDFAHTVNVTERAAGAASVTPGRIHRTDGKPHTNAGLSIGIGWPLIAIRRLRCPLFLR